MFKNRKLLKWFKKWSFTRRWINLLKREVLLRKLMLVSNWFSKRKIILSKLLLDLVKGVTLALMVSGILLENKATFMSVLAGIVLVVIMLFTALYHLQDDKENE